MDEVVTNWNRSNSSELLGTSIGRAYHTDLRLTPLVNAKRCSMKPHIILILSYGPYITLFKFLEIVYRSVNNKFA